MTHRSRFGLLLGKIGFRNSPNKQSMAVLMNCFFSVSRRLSTSLPQTLPQGPLYALFSNLSYSSTSMAGPFHHHALPELHNRRHLGLSMMVYTCWKCNNAIDKRSLFCSRCDALQRPDLTLNYFDIIGIEHKYEISIDELRTKYRQLQNMLHPDRFSNRDKEEAKISEEYSSLVNKAYNTLLQPLSRGLYMLKLRGISIEESRVQSSPEFLMKLMEKNEEIEEAKDAEQLKLLDQRNKSVLEELSKKLADALNSDHVKNAEEVLIEMKYYSSIDSKIKEIKQKRGIGD